MVRSYLSAHLFSCPPPLQKTIEQMEDNQFVGGKDSYQYQVPMAPNAVSAPFRGEACVKGKSWVVDHLRLECQCINRSLSECVVVVSLVQQV